jgi:hypothetical protein
MKKRRDDNRQLKPEELDALENETEEAGTFVRASAEEISTRRIVKPKRCERIILLIFSI